MRKPNIEYPCEWSYKVIGISEQAVKDAVKNVLGDEGCNLSFSKESKGGKYVSFNLDTIVASEEERNNIYTSLSECAGIKRVL